MHRLLILILLTLWGLSGCKNTNSESGLRYGLDTGMRWKTILAAMQAGEIEICFSVKGYDESQKSTLIREYAIKLMNAVNAWEKAMHGHPQWTPTYIVFSQVHPDNCASPAKTLEERPNRISVYAYGNAKAMKKDVKELYDSTGWDKKNMHFHSRSFALPLAWMFILDPNYDLPKADYALTHEFGHLVGLNDTYAEAGRYSGLEDQPDSLMNGRAKVIVADDVNGAWNMWDLHKGTTEECVGGYETDKKAQGGYGHKFCIPSRKGPKGPHIPGFGSQCYGDNVYDPGLVDCRAVQATDKADPCKSNSFVYDVEYQICCPTRRSFDPEKRVCVANSDIHTAWDDLDDSKIIIEFKDGWKQNIDMRPQVQILQRLLNHFLETNGHPGISADGKYGNGTRKALLKFLKAASLSHQPSNAVKKGEKVDAGTWKALKAAST